MDSLFSLRLYQALCVGNVCVWESWYKLLIWFGGKSVVVLSLSYSCMSGGNVTEREGVAQWRFQVAKSFIVSSS